MNQQDYRLLLSQHDWHFEMSDDQANWRAGRNSLRTLQTAQPLVDPDCKIWNLFAPVAMRFTNQDAQVAA